MSKIVTIPTDGMNPFVVMHNGEEYVYPPGATLEVPDGVALEIEEYKRWHKKFYGDNEPPFGAGGGSANIDVTAEVGQTIVVEEVDGNGKPTKWKAAEYQEKICGESFVEIVPTTAVELFEGSESGMPGFYLGEISTAQNISDAELKAVANGITYELTRTEIPQGDGEVPMVFIGNVSLLNDALGTEFDNTGEPFVLAPTSNVFTIYSTVDRLTISILQYGVVTIPPEFLPDVECIRFENVIDNNGNRAPSQFLDPTEEQIAILNRASKRGLITVTAVFYVDSMQAELMTTIPMMIYRTNSTFNMSGVGFFPNELFKNFKIIINVYQSDGRWCVQYRCD